MNAKQRRAWRRRIGSRPPFFCFWCQAELPRFDNKCECKEKYYDPEGPVRRILQYSRITYLWDRAWALGVDFNLEFRQRSPLAEMVDAGKSDEEKEAERKRRLSTLA